MTEPPPNSILSLLIRFAPIPLMVVVFEHRGWNGWPLLAGIVSHLVFQIIVAIRTWPPYQGDQP
jgi:hypothetical protein